MPTENRSHDAAGWIACDDGLHLIQMDKNLSHYGWVFRKVDGGLPYSVREATSHEMAHAQARQHLRIGVAQIAGQAPAPQPRPEPIAWMVGTAIWWTKEEAERDAADTGLDIIPVGPINSSVEVDQLREVIKHSDAQIMRQSMRISNQRAKLAERDALLREQSGKLIVLAARLIQEPLRVLGGYLDNEGPITRNKATHGVEQASDSLGGLALEVRRVADAIYASAETSAPVECNHEMPGTSFQRLNALANQGE